jgi:hypothetical protein
VAYLRIVSLALALLAAVPPSLSAQHSPAGERIARLIAQLGSADFSAREAASRELAALGPAALDVLRRAVEAEDAEIRRRAQKLLRQLEHQTAAARLLQPTHVRFVYDNVPVAEAVTDLARRTEVPFRLTGDAAALAERRLTLDTGEVPFFDALAQFLNRAGLAERGLDAAAARDERYEYTANDRKLTSLDFTRWGAPARAQRPWLLIDGKDRPLPTCQAGAVRFRALPPGTPAFQVNRNDGELLLVLEAMTEPRLQWRGVVAVRIDHAADERGRTLKQPVLASGLGATVGSAAEELLVVWDGVGHFPTSPFGDARHIPIRFRLANGPSQRLQELRGVIAAQVRKPPELLASVDISDEALGRNIPVAGSGTLKVGERRQTEEGGYQVQVTLALPAPELVSSGVPARFLVMPRIWWGPRTAPLSPEDAEFVLVDDRGQRFATTGAEVWGALGKGVSHDFTLHYPALPDQARPARLLYHARRTVVVEIPFTLKDIPLVEEPPPSPK